MNFFRKWICVVFALSCHSVQGETVGTTFTYQGALSYIGSPATGTFDFQFRLFSQESDEAPVSGPLLMENVPVVNGVFAVKLDFGDIMTDGQQYWLESAVREGSDAGEFTVLNPRQQLTATPAAIVSLKSLSAADNSIDRIAVNEAEVQLRITGSCQPGLNISRISESGDVECVAHEVLCPPGWGMSGLDGAGRAICFWTGMTVNSEVSVHGIGSSGAISSLVLGSDGMPLIAYFDGLDLVVTHCSTPECETTTSNSLESIAGQAGIYPDIVVGKDGFPILSYIEAFEDGPDNSAFLRLAICQDLTCSEPVAIETIAQVCENNCGSFEVGPSIATSAQGNPVISFTDLTSGTLKVATCATPDCSGAVTLSDLEIHSSGFSDLAIGSDGTPVIAFHSSIDGDVMHFVRCVDPDCVGQPQVTELGAGILGWHQSVTINPDGLPVIAWNAQGPINFTRCLNLSCSEHETTTFDPPTASLSPSLAVASDGFPILAAYSDPPTLGLHVFKCQDKSCSTGFVETSFLDTEQVDQKVNLVIGADGRPVASYWNATHSMLQVLVCGDRACSR